MTVLPGTETPAVSPRTAQPQRGVPGADPLEQPDAYAAADAAGAENLLRCWVRETGLTEPPEGTLLVPLPASGTALRIPVRHWSAVGHHRFGTARFETGGPPVDAVTVAALIAREARPEPTRWRPTGPTWWAGSPTPYAAPPSSSPNAVRRPRLRPASTPFSTPSRP